MAEKSTGYASTLSLLGLAAVEAAVEAEKLPIGSTRDFDSGTPQLGWLHPPRVATALRNLADAIEGDTAEARELDIYTRVHGDSWLEQELRLRFYLKERADAKD